MIVTMHWYFWMPILCNFGGGVIVYFCLPNIGRHCLFWSLLAVLDVLYMCINWGSLQLAVYKHKWSANESICEHKLVDTVKYPRTSLKWEQELRHWFEKWAFPTQELVPRVQLPGDSLKIIALRGSKVMAIVYSEANSTLWISSCRFSYQALSLTLLPTETGAVMLASRPAPDHTTPKPGFVMRSFFGVDPAILSHQVCYIIINTTW